MYINFNYTLPDNLFILASEEIIGLNNNHQITGWVDQADINSRILNHCSLYMICELEIINNENRLSNPVAIVAKNQTQAMQLFRAITEKDNGTVMCEIIDNCAGLKVKPTGITK